MHQDIQRLNEEFYLRLKREKLTEEEAVSDALSFAERMGLRTDVAVVVIPSSKFEDALRIAKTIYPVGILSDFYDLEPPRIAVYFPMIDMIMIRKPPEANFLQLGGVIVHELYHASTNWWWDERGFVGFMWDLITFPIRRRIQLLIYGDIVDEYPWGWFIEEGAATYVLLKYIQKKKGRGTVKIEDIAEMRLRPLYYYAWLGVKRMIEHHHDLFNLMLQARYSRDHFEKFQKTVESIVGKGTFSFLSRLPRKDGAFREGAMMILDALSNLD